MGRAEHLQQTLPQNIRDNPPSKDVDIEFVVLNYNSKDGLHDWITQDPEIQQHMKSGLLRYGKTTDPEFFHMSHAKNMAHRIATGDVLCNLDADNFTGKGFAEFLYTQFHNDLNIIVNPSTEVSKLFDADNRGFFGRIAISKDNFYDLHGYDETFSGWGDEDTDLMYRAKGSGLRHIRINSLSYLQVISHSDEDRVRNMTDASHIIEEINKIEHKKHNTPLVSRAFNKLKVLALPTQANSDGKFGMGRITLNDNINITLSPITTPKHSAFNICAKGLPELIRGRIIPRLAEEPQDHYDHS